MIEGQPTRQSYFRRILYFYSLALVLSLMGNAHADQPLSPVVVESCGRKLAIAQPPRRAVSYGSNLTEMMLALQLEDRMAGFTSVHPAMQKALSDRYAAMKHLRSLANSGISTETLIKSDADFLFAGWNYGLRAGTEFTPSRLSGLGISVYELTESCANIGKGSPPGFNYLFEDIANLATIFGVKARSDKLIQDYRRRLQIIEDRVAPMKKPSVFVYSGGDRTAMSAGAYSMPQAIINAAGGQNSLADMPYSWLHIGWEVLIDRNPDVIIMLTVPGLDPSDNIRAFLSREYLTSVTAVKHKKIVLLDYDELTPGPRNIDAVEKLARALHPEVFEKGEKINPHKAMLPFTVSK